jgi:hypothetical protein
MLTKENIENICKYWQSKLFPNHNNSIASKTFYRYLKSYLNENAESVWIISYQHEPHRVLQTVLRNAKISSDGLPKFCCEIICEDDHFVENPLKTD